MSAPRFESMASEYINYGFLSAKAVNAIESILAGQCLSQDEARVLKRAEGFLRDVSSGAVLVKTGSFNGNNPNEAMAALDIAMNPIEFLQDAIKEKEIASFFTEMAQAIEESQTQLGEVPSSAKKDKLDNAKFFFDCLYSSLQDSLSAGRPSIGGYQKAGAFRSVAEY